MGNQCGERVSDGSKLLRGSCDHETLYNCPAAKVIAQEKGKCTICKKGDKIGTDFCGIGRKH
jgi:hypothetical protein